MTDGGSRHRSRETIIKLSRCKSSYASVVLGDSKVTFLMEEEDSAFYPSLYCVLLIYGVVKSKF